MPFTAIYTVTGERLNFYQHADRIKTLDSTAFVCPFCEKPMLARAGTSLIRRHFYHRSGECGAEWIDPEYRSESMEHIAGKWYLSRVFPGILKDPATAKNAAITFEHVFVTPTGRKRIADVLVVLPGPQHIALEMQLASITPQKLQERTDDYYAAGMDVFWVFGGSADTHPNRTWARNTQGYCYFLAIDFQPGRTIRQHTGALEDI
jgi:competence CoiA-like predicted nuclease